MCVHAFLQLSPFFYLLGWGLLTEATAYDKHFILWTIYLPSPSADRVLRCEENLGIFYLTLSNIKYFQ